MIPTINVLELSNANCMQSSENVLQELSTIGKLGYIDRTIPYPRWVSKNPCPSPSGGGQGFFDTHLG